MSDKNPKKQTRYNWYFKGLVVFDEIRLANKLFWGEGVLT